jgi:cell cycle protein kinase DBF2
MEIDDMFSDSDKLAKKRRFSNATQSKTEVTDFELLQKIGQGGFGEVYLCKKRDTKEVLALKIIDKTFVWAQNKVSKLQ